jgi:putative ABC transport system permease protein
MMYVAVRMARYRISALLAVACAVLGGAALFTGTGVLAESGLRSHLPAGRLAGVDLVITADQTVRPSQDLPLALPERGPVPAELVQRLAQVPGVTEVVPDLSFPAGLIDARGQVVAAGDPRTAGHGWSSTRLAREPQIGGTAPKTATELALGRATATAAGVEIGDEVRVVAAGQPASYRVTAVVGGVGGVFFADGTAAELAGRDAGVRAHTVDLIGLRAAAGSESAVRKAIQGSGLVVSSGAARGDSAAPDVVAARALLILLAGSLAGIVLLIVGFVVAGALGVSISGQRRELALIRAVGATPRQIRRLAAGQATVVSAVALGPGVALGYLLAGQFRRLLVGIGLLPTDLPLSFSPLPALAAILLIIAVVQVSARGAAWRTSRLPATEAVAESRSEPRSPSRLRTQAGLLLIAVTLALSVAPLLSRTQLGAASTSIAGIVAAIGLALVGPALVRTVSGALARRLPARSSAPMWLAVSNTHGYALRVAGAVSTLAMAVVFVLTYTLAQTTVIAASAADRHAGTLAQYKITAPGLGGVPGGILATVRATKGVSAAVPESSTTVVWSYRQLGDEELESSTALILPPTGGSVLDLGVRKGSLRGLTGRTVAVGSDVARTRNAGLGRSISLILGDGTRTSARVVAVYDRGLGFGPVVLSHDLAAGHTSAGLDQSILVRTDQPATLSALVGAQPGLEIAPATGTRAGGLKSAPPETWINLATILVLLGYLLLGIANKLVAGTAQRANEFAALRLIGTTPAQIRAMVRRESGLIVAGALAAGLLLSAVPLVLLGAGFLHRPWAAGPVWLLPVTVLTVAGIAYLSIDLPTRKALRTGPAEALASSR